MKKTALFLMTLLSLLLLFSCDPAPDTEEMNRILSESTAHLEEIYGKLGAEPPSQNWELREYTNGLSVKKDGNTLIFSAEGLNDLKSVTTETEPLGPATTATITIADKPVKQSESSDYLLMVDQTETALQEELDTYNVLLSTLIGLPCTTINYQEWPLGDGTISCKNTETDKSSVLEIIEQTEDELLTYSLTMGFNLIHDHVIVSFSVGNREFDCYPLLIEDDKSTIHAFQNAVTAFLGE